MSKVRVIGLVVNGLLLMGAMVGVLLFFGRECAGHFYFWYGCDYWEGSWSYLRDRLVCGGLADWLGDWLGLCYRWTWVGAMVMALVVGMVMVCNVVVVKVLGLNDGLCGGAVVCGGLLLILAMNKLFFVGELVFVLLFFLLLTGYCLIRNDWWRWGYGVVGYVLVFFLLPSGVALLLYGSYVMVELWRHRGDLKRCWWRLVVLMLVYTALTLLVPVLWIVGVEGRCLDNVYTLGVVLSQNQLQWVLVLLLCVPMLCVLLGFVLRRVQRRWMVACVYVVLCVVGVLLLWKKNSWASDREYEHFFRVERATVEENWDEVICLSEKEKSEIDRLFPYAVVAHGLKGDLGDVLFDYPVTVKGTFLPASTHKNTDVECNVAFYRGIGMLNHAIAYEFQNGSTRLKTVDVFTLKQLAKLNMEVGELMVAEKYLGKLESVGTEDEFVKELRGKEGVSRKCIEIPVDSVLFFASNHKEMDLCELLLYEPDNRVALDFLLCSLLKMRDCDNFVRYFFKYYPYREVERLPRAYEEFLIMAPYANIALPNRDFKVSEETKRRFEAFFTVYQSNADKRTREMQLRSLKNSWFCYATGN